MKLLLLIGLLIGPWAIGKARAEWVCPAGPPNHPLVLQNCYWTYGAVAMDPRTRQLSSAWNYTNIDSALAEVRKACGASCVSYASAEESYIAADDNDVAAVGDTARQALAGCLKAGGTNCATVAWIGTDSRARYFNFGALCWDTAKREGARVWSQLREREARAGAEEACGSSATVRIAAFNSYFAALAASQTGEVFLGTSNQTPGEARRRALSACADTASKASCEVVVVGNNNSKSEASAKPNYFQQVFRGQ